MTWSLQLQHGDLVLTGAKLGVVTNEQKLLQDLKAHVLERMGTDDMHLGFGSLIDGGTKPDGSEVPSVIGEDDLQLVTIEIESELRRIMAEHRNKQLVRAKDDRYRYGKATLTPGEVLIAVTNISLTQIEDLVHVVVQIQTAAGEHLDISVALPEELLA